MNTKNGLVLFLAFIALLLFPGCSAMKQPAVTIPINDSQYLTWCNSDSVVVGYRFIGGIYDDGKSYSDVYNAKYRTRLYDEFPEHFIASFYFPDVPKVWEIGRQRNIVGLTYIRVDTLKLSVEPTIEGYIKWKGRVR